MSDANGIVLSDVFGLSQPLMKLFETVGCGVGKLYEPWHIKRMAKAKVKEIETISEAISGKLHLPIGYNDGAISISTEDANNLVVRAQNRFLFQEMKKQQNIESVVSNAYSELKDLDSVDSTPVEEDWISEFFNCVANVSAEEMQILWGKLLAGEVKNPGSFSLRTLEVLKRLSLREANIFKEITPFALRCKGDMGETCTDYFLMPDAKGDLLEKYGISFAKIMLLSEAGLLSENNQINIGFNIEAKHSETIKGLNKSIEIVNTGDGTVELGHPVYLLTEAGKELWPIAVIKDYMQEANTYLLECVEELKQSDLTTMDFHEKSDNKNQILFKLADNK